MMTDDKGYEFFEHTADVGMRASGGSLAELFAHAARGLVALVAEDSALRPVETRAVRLRAASVEKLLHAWLSELLMWFDTDRFLPVDYALGPVSSTALQGEVRGERFDPARHIYGTEVKGVTRHQFQVEQRNGRWTATIIFDV